MKNEYQYKLIAVAVIFLGVLCSCSPAGRAARDYLKAKACFEEGDWDGSARYLDALILQMPHRVEYRYLRGICYMKSGKARKALMDFDSVITLQPHNEHAYGSRGLVHEVSGRHEEALDDLTTAIDVLGKNSAELYYTRGRAHYNLGNWSDAIADFTRAVNIDPGYSMAFNARGAAYSCMGNREKAIEDMSHAILLDPENFAAYRNRARTWYRNREYSKAVNDYTEAVSLCPDNHAPWMSLAWLLATVPDAKLRDGSRALVCARKALSLTEESNPNIAESLAAASAEVGAFEEAVSWQQRALASGDADDFRREGMLERLRLYKRHRPYRLPVEGPLPFVN